MKYKTTFKLFPLSLITLSLLQVGCSIEANWEKVADFNYESNYAKLKIETTYKISDIYVELDGNVSPDDNLAEEIFEPVLFALGYVKIITPGLILIEDNKTNFFLDKADYLNKIGFVHESNGSFLPSLNHSVTKIDVIYDNATMNEVEATYYSRDGNNNLLVKPGFYINKPLVDSEDLEPIIPSWRRYDLQEKKFIYYTSDASNRILEDAGVIESTTEGYWGFKEEIDWHNENAFSFYKDKIWFNALPSTITRPEVLQRIPAPKETKHLVLFKTSRISGTNRFAIPKILELEWR